MITGIGNEGMENHVASITIDRPEAGQTVTVAVTPDLRVVLAFNPAAAKFAVEGDDFVLSLAHGGQVVFEGLVSGARGAQWGGDMPTLQVAGIDFDTGVLMEQVLALAEQAEAEPIETAAGADGEGGEAEAGGGGGSRYDDTFGDLIAGLIKQGIIGETDLGFSLIGSGGSEFLVEAEFLSEGYLLSGGGFGPLGAEIPSGPGPLAGGDVPGGDVPGGDVPGGDVPGSGVGSPDPLPDIAPNFGGDGEAVGSIPWIDVDDMTIITNEANGNLQIPDQLILYLTETTNHGAGLSIAGPSYDGVVDNARIWSAGASALDGDNPANTWAQDGDGSIRFHIGGVGPSYEGSFTYGVTDGAGAGDAEIYVASAVTAKAGSYWTLDGTGADEILLGLNGRNQIDGGGGDDIIHGGHDSSGDILIGGDGNDVIFGGSGKDDLRGGNGDDTFILRAGFGRDTLDGGAGTDIIALDSVLTQAEMDDPGSWLTLGGGAAIVHAPGSDTITFSTGTASGTIDLGGGNEITFVDVEQIDYAILG